MKKLTVKLALLFLGVLIPKELIHAEELTEKQKERAEIIAQICTENWEEYGCLPSVCIAQAMQESCLGEVCYPNNLWGLYGGYHSFDSLEDGVYGYMKVLNNGLYDNALHNEEQDELYVISEIVKAGYCSDPNYVSKITSLINTYNLSEYNKDIGNVIVIKAEREQEFKNRMKSEELRVKKKWN